MFKTKLLTLISILFIISCGENIREEITERYEDGSKKLLVKYKGEGSDEVVVERIYYRENGDTLFRENTTKEYVYYDTKEEVTKSYSDGQKEKLLKSRFTMKDDLNDYEITDKYVFDKSGEVVFHEDIIQDTLFVKTLEKETKFEKGRWIVKYQTKYDDYSSNDDFIEYIFIGFFGLNYNSLGINLNEFDELIFLTLYDENNDTIGGFDFQKEEFFSKENDDEMMIKRMEEYVKEFKDGKLK
jgi:hypothetical protein